MLRTFDTGDGRALSYLRRGNGPLVVCVPGGPGLDPEAYFAPVTLPAREMLIFAPRGTGASSPPSSADGYRIEGYVADLDRLRVHLDVERMTLYGNSYGGSVVLAYASAYPERVACLVVSNAAARVDAEFERAVEAARKRFADAVADAAQRLAAADEADARFENEPSEINGRLASRISFACAVAYEGLVEADYLDRLCSAPTNDDAVAGMWVEWDHGLDLLACAHELTMPVLLIAGEHDIVVPPAAVRLIADALPHAQYVEFSGVGHFPAVEARDWFYDTVCSFLDDCHPRDKPSWKANPTMIEHEQSPEC